MAVLYASHIFSGDDRKQINYMGIGQNGDTLWGKRRELLQLILTINFEIAFSISGLVKRKQDELNCECDAVVIMGERVE